jgi:hypothetical protein
VAASTPAAHPQTSTRSTPANARGQGGQRGRSEGRGR